MINNFNEIEMRNSGLIYNSTFNQIKQLYAMDPDLAGELAISAIELVLTGDISSNDPMVALMLEPMRKINENNHVKYDNKVESSRQKKIAELKLDKVAELMNAGYTQKQIGEKLGITQQNVSYRVSVIRTKYPELLQTVQTNLTNSTNATNKNVCENTNTLQTKQHFTNGTNNTNKPDFCTNGTVCTDQLQTVQTKNTNSDENVCKNGVSAAKTGGTKPKMTPEEMRKMGFDF